MQPKHPDYEAERRRLAQTIDIAQDQLDRARRSNEDNKAAIIEAKKELRENTQHAIGSLSSSEGFEALAALSQYMNPVTDKITEYEATETKIARLLLLMQLPYFARIDFRYDDEDVFEPFYIGRSSLMKEASYEMVVYDWRSPVASVFYRFATGRAFYEAPVGTITGELGLKRQYEISNGTLDYFFDADVQILDEFLRKLLSQNTSVKMKAIVETIQREQDIVIRDMENDLMMVQGVAGSGKTSIALHRAAYLMYQGLSSARVSANHIVIVSPNALFERYISQVLPDLGEDNVVSVVFEEMLASILGAKNIQSKNRFLEALLTNAHDRDIMKSSIEFKLSRMFLQILERYINGLPFVAGRGKKAASDLNVKHLYVQLLSDEETLHGLTDSLTLPANIGEIISYTRENLLSKTLFYDDAVVLAFLKVRLCGNNAYRHIKQVVIDEAQDYYPMHYEMFKMLFASAKYTILGDINQTLEKREDLSLYRQIGDILNRKRATLVTMDKSFRCTNEILAFSSNLIAQGLEVKSFNRAGDEPEVFAAQSPEELAGLLVTEAGRCLDVGYRSIGLICKTQKNAQALFRLLAGRLDATLIKTEGAEDLEGVFIIPVYMSKGLEFDAVLICDADNVNYHGEEDRKLLYIAATRALHRLHLYCVGEVSGLLAFSDYI